VRAWLAVVLGCGAPAPNVPSNHVTSERPELMSTTLKIYVQDVRAQCGAKGDRAHVDVLVDGRQIGTIVVFCMRAPAQSRQFRLAQDPVVIEGWHRIGVRHVESGRAASRDFAFPAGRPADPHEPWIERDKLRVTMDVATLAIGELSVF
jgi:hypothetical protein